MDTNKNVCRKRIVDLENMAYCRCPRVYWPVCAKNNITYMNYCIMDCLDQDIRRYGPCIHYRRSGDSSDGFLGDK
ncbi:hypothetical protein ABMA28_010248 [Loxostege sticticalis]|uniref:Kazal-like domain-containing protein n=1 Tax=Loxostege sticticalis TaxID=481309 RepID=A0ABD0SA65_LOXSC